MSHSLLGFLILALYCTSMQLRRRIVPTPEHPFAAANNPVAAWLEQGTWHMAHGTWHVLLAKGSCSATGILLHVKVERGGG